MTRFVYLTAEEWGRRLAHPMQTERLGDPDAIVHHTAGNDAGTSIEAFRRVNESDIGRGYACVGYDVLIHRDKSTGVVAIGEGRGGFRSAATADWNEEGEAYCLIGYFHPGHKLSRQPHPDELEGIARAIVWGVERGWNAPNPRILGHRDNPAHPGATGCPGDYLYVYLPWIRQRVAELLNTPKENDMPDLVDHPPTRVLDTRQPGGGGKLKAGKARRVAVTMGTRAQVNVTVTEPAAAGWVAVSPDSDFSSPTSLVNFVAGQTIANATRVSCPGGHMWVLASADCHLVLDVSATGA